MTPRERFEKALRFEEPDRPPHFEQMFELVNEAFGMMFPSSEELDNSSGSIRLDLFRTCAEIYAKTIECFEWDAVLIWRPAERNDVYYDFIRYFKKYIGANIPVGGFIWGSAICIDTIRDYMQFAVELYENRPKLHSWAEEMLTGAVEHAKKLIDSGVDFISINNDYAFNSGTFLQPKDFAELTTPYMKRLVNYIKKQDVKVIFHSDGNLMQVLDQILEISPDVLHSIDPMAGMDIAEVKRLTYGRTALMGNVQCSLLQDGPPEAIIESAQYAIKSAAPGGGYIYSTSNTIFPGLPLENYKLMVDYMHQMFLKN